MKEILYQYMDIIVKWITNTWSSVGDFATKHSTGLETMTWIFGIVAALIGLRLTILGISLIRKHIKENFNSTKDFLNSVIKKDIQKAKSVSVWFYNDLFSGWSKKEAIYAWFLIAVQIIVFIFNPDSILGFLTALSGTICVLLVAKRKMSNYFFGFIQTGVAFALGLQVFLIGETGENLFYFVTQFWGIKTWRENMLVDAEKEEEVVKAEKFNLKQWVLTLAILIGGTAVLGFIFGYFNGTQPYADAFTLITAIVAQMLMLFRYREQWLLWASLNIVSLFSWYGIGNMSMVGLYVVMLINSIFGYIQWSKEQKELEAVLAKEELRNNPQKPIAYAK